MCCVLCDSSAFQEEAAVLAGHRGHLAARDRTLGQSSSAALLRGWPSGSSQSPPRWLGSCGGAGLPAGKVAPPTSSRLGRPLHKGENCSHRGVWTDDTSGHCVLALEGVGRGVSHCWPAGHCGAGAGLPLSPWLDPPGPAFTTSGSRGRQRL